MTVGRRSSRAVRVRINMRATSTRPPARFTFMDCWESDEPESDAEDDDPHLEGGHING